MSQVLVVILRKYKETLFREYLDRLTFYFYTYKASAARFGFSYADLFFCALF